MFVINLQKTTNGILLMLQRYIVLGTVIGCNSLNFKADVKNDCNSNCVLVWCSWQCWWWQWKQWAKQLQWLYYFSFILLFFFLFPLSLPLILYYQIWSFLDSYGCWQFVNLLFITLVFVNSDVFARWLVPMTFLSALNMCIAIGCR